MSIGKQGEFLFGPSPASFLLQLLERSSIELPQVIDRQAVGNHHRPPNLSDYGERCSREKPRGAQSGRQPHYATGRKTQSEQQSFFCAVPKPTVLQRDSMLGLQGVPQLVSSPDAYLDRPEHSADSARVPASCILDTHWSVVRRTILHLQFPAGPSDFVAARPELLLGRLVCVCPAFLYPRHARPPHQFP